MKAKLLGVVLSGSKNYYLQGAYIDQIAFKYYPDVEAVYAAYKAGEVAGLVEATWDILPQVLLENQLNLYTTRMPAMTLLYLNIDDPQATVFQDVNIRKALIQGLNRQALVGLH